MYILALMVTVGVAALLPARGPAATAAILVVPLMLFHQIQLVACAILARRRGR